MRIRVSPRFGSPRAAWSQVALKTVLLCQWCHGDVVEPHEPGGFFVTVGLEAEATQRLVLPTFHFYGLLPVEEHPDVSAFHFHR